MYNIRHNVGRSFNYPQDSKLFSKESEEAELKPGVGKCGEIVLYPGPNEKVANYCCC